MQRIRCELVEIAGGDGTELDRVQIIEQDIQAVVELSLSVTQDGKVAPAFSFIQAPLTFATGFSYERSREQNFTTYLTFSLAELSQTRLNDNCKLPADTNLSGTLGLKHFFAMKNTAGPFKVWSKDGPTGVFGGSITFTVDAQLTATGPTWKLTTFEGPGSLLSASNKNVDRLTFGFVRGPKAGRARAQVEAFSVINSVRQNQIANSLQILANSR
ncbi:hypothetical protein [Methylobacterium radiodurans]|uniref:hypothetical protein n=1 Tax=Methylobacterium radiodurans TaxID=2202828 RepID=UPI0013A5B8C1|nr:hypothetical protein [Methylobacterium radiodurans]